MREGNALQVFYDEKLVGTLAMTADHTNCSIFPPCFLLFYGYYFIQNFAISLKSDNILSNIILSFTLS